jgi:CheY-like chemotaxis protein
LGARRGSESIIFACGVRSIDVAVALVVEDEWLVRMEMAEALGEAGWTVLEASTGEAALLVLKAEPPVDLVVTDIRLPGPLTGWDVADAFRAANPKVGVIYCSGNACEPLRQLDESVFLTKPCRIDYLLQMGVKLCPHVVLIAPDKPV